MTIGSKPRRPFGLGAYVVMLIGVTLIGGVVGGVAVFLGDVPGPLGLGLTAAAMTFAMGVALAACVWWWRGIDEAAREAHKWAWWWGGCSGMAVGAIVLTTLSLRDDGSAPAGVDLSAADLISGGMWTILLFQLAGYAVAWAAWWLKHR